MRCAVYKYERNLVIIGRKGGGLCSTAFMHLSEVPPQGTYRRAVGYGGLVGGVHVRNGRDAGGRGRG